MENKRYHIVIASVIFAVLMWVSINMGYEYTEVKYVPVVIENLKEGKVFKYPVPKFISVRFKGTGWQLASIYLSPNVKYYIDALSLSSHPYVVTGKALPEHVRLPLSVQILEVIPDTLVLALDDYKEKRVPVIPRVSIICKEGFGRVGPTHVAPESVTVSGSALTIESITEWRTIPTKFERRYTSINEEIPLEDPPTFSINVSPLAVVYQVDIEHFAEKTFSGVPLSALGSPPNREVIFIPPKMDIIARGGIDQLAKLSNNDFQLTVDYNTIVQDSSGIVVPVLNSPQLVQVIRKIPEQFQFIIRKRL